MAILNKIIQSKVSKAVNTLQKEDGTNTEPGLETLKLLARTHFPAAIEQIPHQVYDSTDARMEDLRDKYDWITLSLTRRALKLFKGDKAPGPDGLRPMIFKYFPNQVMEHITDIYRGCIGLWYTPLLWKKSKVIFLPKPGKETYRKPKSFRPISLSNFLLKGLERLIVWRMDEQLRLPHTSESTRLPQR